MPAPGIYHVIGTEVNGSRRIESATFEDGYYDDPGFEIEYWLEEFEMQTINRDKVIRDDIKIPDDLPDTIEEAYQDGYKDALCSLSLPELSEDEIDKLISKTEDEHPYKETGNRDSYSEYNEGWTDACDILGERFKAALKQLTNKK